jgi:hypothetical protein
LRTEETPIEPVHSIDRTTDCDRSQGYEEPYLRVRDERVPLTPDEAARGDGLLEAVLRSLRRPRALPRGAGGAAKRECSALGKWREMILHREWRFS